MTKHISHLLITINNKFGIAICTQTVLFKTKRNNEKGLSHNFGNCVMAYSYQVKTGAKAKKIKEQAKRSKNSFRLRFPSV